MKLHLYEKKKFVFVVQIMTSKQEGESKTEAQTLQILPAEVDVAFINKLKDVFGIEGARAVLRLIRAMLIRKMHTVLVWGNWYLTKLDIAGLRLRVTVSRYYGDLVYEITIRAIIEDIDPLLIKKNLRDIYKMAGIDKEQEKIARDIEAVVAKYIREQQLEEEELEATT
jgi:hypothetical protein